MLRIMLKLDPTAVFSQKLPFNKKKIIHLPALTNTYIIFCNIWHPKQGKTNLTAYIAYWCHWQPAAQ